MSFQKYYKQLQSQTGIKAYVKKRLFNHLLKELVKQEKEIEKQKKTINSLFSISKKQEQDRAIQNKTLIKMEKMLLEQKSLLLSQEMLITTLASHTMLPEWKTKKIVQLVPGVNYGDAVGNDVIALQKYLTDKGYNTGLYAPRIDARLKNLGIHYLSVMPVMQVDDILIYHYTHCPPNMEQILNNCNCRKIMIYHNITPPVYFQKYRPEFAKLLSERRIKLQGQKDLFMCCLTDSEYNKVDLQNEGYSCPIEVLPILVPVEDYMQTPDGNILERYSHDGITNILFVGRIVPNKRIEDVIRVFSYYHININSKSRLFIVGSDAMGGDVYPYLLKSLVEDNGMEEHILFTGHISFTELLAYYKLADVFLCMSEHEGFCVPLIEAMLFSVPILAYDAAAVPETIGDAGIIVNTKDPATVAESLHRLVTDLALRESLSEKMQKRIDYFSYKNITEKFESYLNAMIK